MGLMVSTLWCLSTAPSLSQFSSAPKRALHSLQFLQEISYLLLLGILRGLHSGICFSNMKNLLFLWPWYSVISHFLNTVSQRCLQCGWCPMIGLLELAGTVYAWHGAFLTSAYTCSSTTLLPTPCHLHPICNDTRRRPQLSLKQQ